MIRLLAQHAGQAALVRRADAAADAAERAVARVWRQLLGVLREERSPWEARHRAAEVLHGLRPALVQATGGAMVKVGRAGYAGAARELRKLPPAYLRVAARRRDLLESVELLEARFRRHPSSQPDEVMIWVDVDQLDALWRETDPTAYIPTEGEGQSEVRGRREGVKRFLATGKHLQAPRLDVGVRGLGFVDGRHRFAVLRDQGARRVAVMVPRDQVANVRAMLAGKPGFGFTDLAAPLRGPGLTDASQREAIADMLFEPPSEATILRLLNRGPDPWFVQLDRATRLASPEALAQVIGTQYALGKSQREIAKALLPVVDGVRVSARRIARTEGVRIGHALQMHAHDALGDLVIGYTLRKSIVPDSRPWHIARDGQEYYRHPGPGQKGYYQMPHPPEEPADPHERPAGTPHTAWNCLLPGSIVQGAFVAALKAFYAGKAVELVSANGTRLRVTANHPILTTQGFIPAQHIQKGQQLVRYVGAVERLELARPQHEYHDPAPVEQVFRAIKQLSGPIAARPRFDEDLHGDARFVQGEIEVVRPDRELMLHLQASSLQRCADTELRGGGVQQLGVPRSGAGTLDGLGVSLAAPSLVGRLSLPAPLPVVNGVEPSCELRVGHASQLHASRYEQAGESKGLAAAVALTAAGDAGFLRQLLEGFPRVVAMDKIIEVRHFEFAGHVYDLQSPGGWIVAENAFISNCLCFLTPILRPL